MSALTELKQGFWVTAGVMAALFLLGVIVGAITK